MQGVGLVSFLKEEDVAIARYRQLVRLARAVVKAAGPGSVPEVLKALAHFAWRRDAELGAQNACELLAKAIQHDKQPMAPSNRDVALVLSYLFACEAGEVDEFAAEADQVYSHDVADCAVKGLQAVALIGPLIFFKNQPTN